jgi:hypothetical protein
VRNDFHFILHYRLSERVEELTVGFWQDAYKGDVGRLVFGIQYGNFKLNGDGDPQPRSKPE